MQRRLRERWSTPLCHLRLQGEFLHLSRTIAHTKTRQRAGQPTRISTKKSAYTRSSAEKTAVPAQSTTPPPSPTPQLPDTRASHPHQDTWHLRQTGLLIRRALSGLRNHCRADHGIMACAATSPHLSCCNRARQAAAGRAHGKTKAPLSDDAG